MSPPRSTDIAYVAGLVDGEGCIRIEKREYGRLVAHELQVSVANTHKSTLTWLKDTFGGSVGRHAGGRKQCWLWRLNGNKKVESFLTRIRPFMRIKEAEAWLALEFAAQRITRQGKRGVPVEELALREGYRLALKAAKR